MELLIFAGFLTILTVFSLLGWTADSRDGADWAPTESGVRRSRRVVSH